MISTILFACNPTHGDNILPDKAMLLPRPRRGLRGIVFTRSVCVCVCVCVSVCLCVCPANILVFYFSAIRRDIDLKFMQDIYRVVLNTQKNIDLHRSKVKVSDTY